MTEVPMLIVPIEKIREMMLLDLTGKIEKRMGMDYLAWGDAELLLREYFPTVKVMYGVETVERGDVVYVAVHSWLLDVTTGLTTPKEYFPVMDGTSRRADIPNPGPRSISDAIKRAGVKVIARETGIGLPLYLKDKDDVPEEKLERNKTYASTVSKGTEVDFFTLEALPDDAVVEPVRKTGLKKLI